ncbi:serine C-palmitoyltransferase subunit [Heterostelium album PN500]|uniref:serine C-palmitoyltransferase n=1 Tax=Heterostelium pallidum (strain ATCC 26659 / Pp 5 / PN500) TaxID=670386 RepID=D3B5Y1_HETP5|nr:serine C-palmitoyltransferase subunit [Heterostelium album PN500]EFA83279.1 serine C-palmitoyltransferase subunit [Heterostelium album PN500]|eukprot:XP_020435396.1 serine C-palmitoyltransferase subunit [Heterostelium album PN500]
MRDVDNEEGDIDDIDYWTICWIYIAYGIIIFVGKIADLIDKIRGHRYFITPKGYAPLFVEFEYFYQMRLYSRIKDCWDRPICSLPGAWIDVMLRTNQHYSEPLEYVLVGILDGLLTFCLFRNKFRITGETKRCLNLGSYNYLGFAQNEGPIAEAVIESMYKYGGFTSSTPAEDGTTEPFRLLERETARFVGKEDALVFEMGFATNSGSLPALVGKGALIISDSLNHASLATGCKNTGTKIKVFKHNDTKHLEQVIRESIIQGQPKTHRPWTMILIIVEGIYSMEGEIGNLPEIIRIKKKYNCYLYVDEAHSIGALGSHGRGVCDHYDVDPKDVDILMGTFTKSFGSIGGYIAADKSLIDHLRQSSFAYLYANSMAPPCAMQAYQALRAIAGDDGTDIGARKIKQLKENSNFFRERLRQMGFQILGGKDSPVVPLMFYNPSKIATFSRMCLERHIAVVVVGYPATPLTSPRARFCLSASHTREDLEWALEHLDTIGDQMNLKFKKPIKV